MRSKKRRSSKRNNEFVQTVLFFSSSILSIGGLIAYLWIYTEIDQTVINIETQKQVYNELENSINELEIEISQLSRGDRISYVARNELNMVPAVPETIMIFIDDENYAQVND